MPEPLDRQIMVSNIVKSTHSGLRVTHSDCAHRICLPNVSTDHLPSSLVLTIAQQMPDFAQRISWEFAWACLALLAPLSKVSRAQSLVLRRWLRWRSRTVC